MRPRLSVIVPAYNEANRIIPTLEHIDRFIRAQSYSVEVIIVDDCSSDDTSHVVQEVIKEKKEYTLVSNASNVGKGASVQRGMALAQGEWLLFSDADMSTPIEEVNGFFQYVEPHKNQNKFEVVIGSRRVRGSKIDKRQPIYREAAGRIFSVIVRLLTLQGFIDTQCGFKLFSRESAQKIFPLQTIPGFGFDVEVLFIAQEIFHYKIKEAPVLWIDSPTTKVRLVRDSLRMFIDLITIRLNNRRGKYKLISHQG